MNLIATSELAARLNKTTATIASWVKSGRIPKGCYSTKLCLLFDWDKIVESMGLHQAQDHRREVSEAEIIAKVVSTCCKRRKA